MLFMLAYVLNTALSFIFIHIIGNIIPDFLMVFLSITFSIFFFNLLNYKHMLSIYQALFAKFFKLLFFLNLYAFIIWIGSFLIPIYYSPSVFLMTMLFVTAICGNFSIYKNLYKNNFLIYANILICLNLIYLLTLYSHEIDSFSRFIIFAISSIGTGIFGFFYLKTSQKIGEVIKLKSTQVLAIRFWLLWAVSIILVLYNKQLNVFEFHFIPKILFIAIITLILPVYFLQKAIEKIGANKTGILSGLVPFIIVIIEIIVLHQRPEFIFPAIFHGLIISIVHFIKKR